MAWSRIRSLRARRPLLADDGARRAVFSAALEQSEQLFGAAAASGPAAKPLPLFYALSQAGRAIAAAHNESEAWNYSGHGLSVRINPNDIRQTTVTVMKKPDASDAVSAVAVALDSARLEGSFLVSELAGALPDLTHARALTGTAHGALEVHPEGGHPNYLPSLHPARGRVYARAADESQLCELLSHYYATDGYQLLAPFTARVSEVTTVLLEWPGQPRLSATPGTKALRTLDEIAPRVGDRFYLIPKIGQTGAVPHRILIWWALLIALSSLARYHPAEWVAALDVNDSEPAVALEQTLATAEDVLPDLIADALGSPRGLPHPRMRQAFAEHIASLREAAAVQAAVTPVKPEADEETE